MSNPTETKITPNPLIPSASAASTTLHSASSSQTMHSSAQPTAADNSIPKLDPTVQKLLEDVLALQTENAKAKLNAQAAAKTIVEAKPEEIDWTKVTEADIVRLDIPIPVIEQEVPEYLTVWLLDQNSICRWVHTMRERLGPMLSSGYSFVKEEDIDKRYPHPLSFDAEGNYSFGDVVCLKTSKARYFGALKRTHLKTMALHGRAVSRGRIAEAIQDDDHLGDAFKDQSIAMYTPDDMKGKAYTKDMFSSV